MLQFDEALSRQIEATYRTRDVVEQRRVLLDVLAPRPGEQVLDIGSGPGFLARELAEAVGPSGHVHGIDPSEAMVSLARSPEPTSQAAPVEFAAVRPGANASRPVGLGRTPGRPVPAAPAVGAARVGWLLDRSSVDDPVVQRRI